MLSLPLAAAAVIALVAWLARFDSSPSKQPEASATNGAHAASNASTDRDVANARVEPLESSRVEPVRGDPAATERAPIEAHRDPITLVGAIKDVTRATPTLPRVGLTFTGSDDVAHAVDVPSGQEYRVDGLPPGRVHITARADGFEPLDEQHEAHEGVLMQRLNLYLRPLNSISIRLVNPDGTDLTDYVVAEHGYTRRMPIAIVATQSEPGATIPLVVEASTTRYEHGTVITTLGAPPATGLVSYRGIYTLAEPLPVYVSACRSTAVLATQRVTVAGSEVELTILPETLRATMGAVHYRVVDAQSGAPLDSARAAMLPEHSPRGFRSRMPHSNLQLDKLLTVGADVRLEDCEPGVHVLDLAALDHERVCKYVVVQPGGVTDLGTYRLMPAATIDGSVHDASGKRCAGVRVEALPIDGDTAARAGTLYDCRSDAAGHFELDLLGRRKYLVRTAAASGEGSIEVDTSSGSFHDVALTLKHATPVTVRRTSDDVGWTVISIFDERHLLVVEKPFVEDHWVVHLAPGVYSYEAEGIGCPRFARGTFAVETTPVDVQVSK
jgi:hypothetical protein